MQFLSCFIHSDEETNTQGEKLTPTSEPCRYMLPLNTSPQASTTGLLIMQKHI